MTSGPGWPPNPPPSQPGWSSPPPPGQPGWSSPPPPGQPGWAPLPPGQPGWSSPPPPGQPGWAPLPPGQPGWAPPPPGRQPLGPAGQPGWPPAQVGGDPPRRRLHPLSPLLHSAKSLVVIITALSWSALSELGLGLFALVVAVFAAGASVLAVISWLNTGYHVVGRELRVQEGLLWRRHRAIPLERLQAVEVVRPLLARLTGLAELRLEVVGGSKAEAPLAYLTVPEALELRTQLLALAGHPVAAQPLGAPAPPTAGWSATAAGWPAPELERPLYAVANRDLLTSQLLTAPAFFLPIGVGLVAAQFWLSGAFNFVGVASGLTAMAGVLLQPLRRVSLDWNFQLARDTHGRLAIRHGLLETRNQTVPQHRVQAVSATWPLLWRRLGWLYVRLDVAGLAGPQPGNDKGVDRLLPVGDLPTARRLVAEVLPGVDLAALPTATPPARARWLNPITLRTLGAGLTDAVFVTRWGLFTRELSAVPYARIQSVRVVQGPLQRLLRLATVYADTAGGRAGMARDRDLAEAWSLAAELTSRARQARGSKL